MADCKHCDLTTPHDHQSGVTGYLLIKPEALTTAEARISELETQLAAVPQPLDFQTLEQELYFRRQFLTDVIDDMECLPGCDSFDHEELCPVTDPMQAFRQLREQNALLKRENEAMRRGWFTVPLGSLEQPNPNLSVPSTMTDSTELKRSLESADQAGLVEALWKQLDEAERSVGLFGAGERYFNSESRAELLKRRTR